MASEAILIVDDNAYNLKLLHLLLMGEGYQTRTAVDAENALTVLASFKPRLILMDIQLPGMDGLELTQKLKQDPSTRDILVVALTAYAMRGDDERARAAGCDAYIAKPIDIASLPQTVASLLATQPSTP